MWEWVKRIIGGIRKIIIGQNVIKFFHFKNCSVEIEINNHGYLYINIHGQPHLSCAYQNKFA